MIVVIDYGMGNLHSVIKALKRIGVEGKISSNKEDIKKASKLILPGIGHFKKGMDNLRELDLIKTLDKRVLEDKVPLLGICLGMQLFSKRSEEGDSEGLGWIDAETLRFNLEKLKVPHMGWNIARSEKKNSLLEKEESQFYFVHSFHLKCNEKKDILAKTTYGQEFVSAIQKDNIFGVQFHPEKSHSNGLKILKNFVENV